MDLVECLVAALDVYDVEELEGGHQSRVFRVTDRSGLPVVAKVLDGPMADRGELDARLDVTAALADLDPRVCRPLLRDGRRVTEIASPDGRHQYYAVCFELALGAEPDPASTDDATRMGAALATLHVSMSRLPATSLPVVRALRDAPPDDAPGTGQHQLLHGDFHASNLRQAAGVVRIFDLDDCGYGPLAFDVANALYMVLFDSVTHGSIDTYQRFRRSFIDGYAAVSPVPPEAILERFIDLRVRTLGSWLDDLDNAPIGIRTASQAWQATLRSFVASHRRVTD